MLLYKVKVTKSYDSISTMCNQFSMEKRALLHKVLPYFALANFITMIQESKISKHDLVHFSPGWITGNYIETLVDFYAVYFLLLSGLLYARHKQLFFIFLSYCKTNLHNSSKNLQNFGKLSSKNCKNSVFQKLRKHEWRQVRAKKAWIFSITLHLTKSTRHL